MLKNRGVAVVSRRVGIPARRDRSFILSAKWRGFSFLHFERNKDRALFYERKRKFIFLLGAKGGGFLSYTLKETKPEFICKRIKKICFLLGAKRNKSGRGNFPSFPLHPKTPHTPTNVIFRTSGTSAPLSKGAKSRR